jgi:hypothetical protein
LTYQALFGHESFYPASCFKLSPITVRRHAQLFLSANNTFVSAEGCLQAGGLDRAALPLRQAWHFATWLFGGISSTGMLQMQQLGVCMSILWMRMITA